MFERSINRFLLSYCCFAFRKLRKHIYRSQSHVKLEEIILTVFELFGLAVSDGWVMETETCASGYCTVLNVRIHYVHAQYQKQGIIEKEENMNSLERVWCPQIMKSIFYFRFFY